jgi:hypothetical protein
MLLGALVFAGGLAVLALAGGVLGAAALTAGVLGRYIPALAYAGVPVLALGGIAAIFTLILAALLLVAGGIWFGVNAFLVLVRLSPDYKAGPATEYPDL